MRLSPRLRRAGDADPASPTPASDAPARPTPPRGSPVAAYAAVLDGRTFWLALEPVPGTLGLREEAGEVHVLPSDLPDDDPAYLSVRADLLAIPGDGERSYDVVVVDNELAATVWTAPFEPTPMRTPVAPGGSWQFALERTEAGMLRVRRSRPAPRCDLLRIDLTASGVRLTLAPPSASHDAQLSLLALEEGQVVATCPLERDGVTLVATITDRILPEGRDQLLRWGVGSADAWVPVRRSSDGLAQPNAAVVLPVLPGQETDVPRLRMRWAPDGSLLARVVDPAPDGPTPDGPAPDDPTPEGSAA